MPLPLAMHRSLLILVGLAPFCAAAPSALAQPPEARPRLRAVRASAPVRVDGDLDEATWAAAPAFETFRQVEPMAGEAARFDTRVRILFDDEALYVGAEMRDTAGAAGVRVQDLRRDFDDTENDLLGLVFDPFGDERNAQAFAVNPAGALRDLLAKDGDGDNAEWDAVWSARTAVSDSGWTAEIAIPWATLRYRPGARAWGFNVYRIARRANEVSALAPWPRAEGPYRMDLAGMLDGVQPPPPSRNLRVQPYIVVRAAESGGRRRGPTPVLGGEAKWAATTSTVVDLTVNTDFAQADADRQVVNLSRFSVFFPERRGFFLENAELFSTGSTLVVQPFFSRRIGLNQGRPVPLDAGARVVTQAERFSAGALAARQRGDAGLPAATFGVVRGVRNVGAASRVGVLAVARHTDADGAAPARTNAVVTLDGFARLSRTAAVTAIGGISRTSGAGGEGASGYVWLRNNADWGYVGHVQGIVTRGFLAETGFVPRTDFVLTSPAVFLDLRPHWRPRGVRAFDPGVEAYVYHRASNGRFQEATATVTPVAVSFDSGAELDLFANLDAQRLSSADTTGFRPLGLRLAPGRYSAARVGLSGATDRSRRLSATASVSTGRFFDGRISTASGSLRAAPSPRLAFALDYRLDRVAEVGPEHTSATSHLVAPELRVALSPRLLGLAVYQYSALERTGVWNARLSWEFRPLSYVYLVFNEVRAYERHSVVGTGGGTERGLLLKATYLRTL